MSGALALLAEPSPSLPFILADVMAIFTGGKGCSSIFIVVTKANRPDFNALLISRLNWKQLVVRWVNELCHLQYGLPRISSFVANFWPRGTLIWPFCSR